MEPQGQDLVTTTLAQAAPATAQSQVVDASTTSSSPEPREAQEQDVAWPSGGTPGPVQAQNLIHICG